MARDLAKSKDLIQDLYKQNINLNFKSLAVEERFQEFIYSKSLSILQIFTIPLTAYLIYEFNFTLLSLTYLLSFSCLLLILSRYDFTRFNRHISHRKCSRLLQFILMIFFQVQLLKHGTLILITDFFYHFFSMLDLRYFLASLLFKEFFFSFISDNCFEYLLIALVLLVIKKDTKDLWAIQDYFISICKKYEIKSKNITTGYFITSETGKILEANNTGEKILAQFGLTVSDYPNIGQIFTKESTEKIFNMFLIAKSDFMPEEEFIYIFSDASKCSLFNSLSIKVIPIVYSSNKTFVMILKDISKFTSFTSIILQVARKTQKIAIEAINKIIEDYRKNKLLTEDDSQIILGYLYRQEELVPIMDWFLGCAYITLSDFDIKTEVIHTSWANWKNKNIKINLLCDKDIPCAKSDRHKHNLLIRILLEYSLQLIDENNDILLTVSRSVTII